jgi:hypothetical protein
MRNLHYALKECIKLGYKDADQVFANADLFRQMMAEFLDIQEPYEYFNYLNNIVNCERIHYAIVDYMRHFGSPDKQEQFFRQLEQIIFNSYRDHIQSALDDYWDEKECLKNHGVSRVEHIFFGGHHG